MNEHNWHIYRNNPDSQSERGKFVGVHTGPLDGSVAIYELAGRLEPGRYIAVFHGSCPKSDGVPPIRFIDVVRSDVEVTVR